MKRILAVIASGALGFAVTPALAASQSGTGLTASVATARSRAGRLGASCRPRSRISITCKLRSVRMLTCQSGARGEMTVNVTIPKGFKTSLPASQTFMWSASVVKLAGFVLN